MKKGAAKAAPLMSSLMVRSMKQAFDLANRVLQTTNENRRPMNIDLAGAHRRTTNQQINQHIRYLALARHMPEKQGHRVRLRARSALSSTDIDDSARIVNRKTHKVRFYCSHADVRA